LGQFSYIAGDSIINNVFIGKYCSIGLGLKVGLGIHPTDFVSTCPIFYSASDLGGIQITKKNVSKNIKRQK
jgi:hypothetical protein